ncbi:MAG: ABC transporter permease, partial [Methylococcaceae bacterium]|nr:ABC transporter permease [Methylococcaceae bacterium]
MGGLTLFWTDGLFFALLLAMGLGIWRMSRREHFRRPWRSVSGSRSAVISATVLAAYLLIGVLDSIHFYPAADQTANGQFKTEAVSLLDWWAAPLRTRVEKTYSAPLAVQGYARELITGADGSQRWDFPRLQHGGVHLQDPARDWLGDVSLTAVLGLVKGIVFWMVLVAVAAFLQARRLRVSWRDGLAALGGQPEQQAWRWILSTMLVIVLLGWTLAELGLKYHVFGTDKVGEDVLLQSLKSIRTGLLIGTLTTFVTLPLAMLLGISAGYFRGWVDDLIQYLYTTLNSIPGVLLIAASMLLMQAYIARHESDFASLALRADFRLLFLCLILGLTSWTSLCRLLRAETLKLREMEYVQAARALGVWQGTILLRHIVPNVFHLVLISVALDF